MGIKKPQVLWIDNRSNISDRLTYSGCEVIHTFATWNAQRKIKQMSDVSLLISNLFVNECKGRTVPDYIRDNRQEGYLFSVPILIYTDFVSNQELSRTPIPFMCTQGGLRRLDQINQMEGTYFLSSDSKDYILDKAVEILIKQ